jgi:ABC-type nitrate/sulfonate/bicarbonate transport system permease component
MASLDIVRGRLVMAADDSTIILSGRLLLGAGLLLLWQFYPALFGTNPFWLSQPTLIFGKAVALYHDGTLLPNVAVTVWETFLGLALGSVAGIAIGLAIGLTRSSRDICEPFLLIANAFPKIAMAPLFMIWFGIGLWMKVAVAFSLVVVVMALSAYSGMRMIRPELVNSTRAMGGSQAQIFRKIVLPSIAPWLLAGFRVSLTFALIGAVLGEFIAAQSGLGYMIDDGMATFDSNLVFLALAILFVLVWIANAVMEWTGRRFGIDENSPTMAYNS